MTDMREALERAAAQKLADKYLNDFSPEGDGARPNAFAIDVVRIVSETIAASPQAAPTGVMAWRNVADALARAMAGIAFLDSGQTIEPEKPYGEVMRGFAMDALETWKSATECLSDAHSLASSLPGREIELGDMVRVRGGSSDFAGEWQNTELKVVSISIEPNGHQWASVIEVGSRHRGNGKYDGETTDFDMDHLALLARPVTPGEGNEIHSSDGGGESRPAIREQQTSEPTVHGDRKTPLASAGQKAGVAPGPSEATPAEPIDAQQPEAEARGPFCRDCADENGICPHSGLPCDPAPRPSTPQPEPVYEAGWRDISSAPRDETPILLTRDGIIPLVGYCGPYRTDWWLPHDAGKVWFNPTHWRPLPSPPKGGADGK